MLLSDTLKTSCKQYMKQEDLVVGRAVLARSCFCSIHCILNVGYSGQEGFELRSCLCFCGAQLRHGGLETLMTTQSC
jgi:hypothetical protein